MIPALIWVLLIIPMLIGESLSSIGEKKGDKRGGFERCVADLLIGFVVEVAVFAVLCIPMVLMQVRFHVLVYSATAVYVLITIAALLYLGWKLVKASKDSKGYQKRGGANPLLLLICLGAVLVIGWQSYRLAFMQVNEYRDDKVYVALVNDMVSSDQMYMQKDIKGDFYESALQNQAKYLLSTWYPFEAYCAYVSGLHANIICKSIMPALILVLAYLAYYLMSVVLFPRKKGKYQIRRAMFILSIAVMIEMVRSYTDQELIMTTWPAWGKNVVATVVLPFIIYQMMAMYGSKKKTDYLILLATAISGSFLSTMGVFFVPVEVSVVMLGLWISEKRRPDLVYFVIAALPSFLGFAIYVILKKMF